MTQSNRAVLQAIEYHLPEARVTNDALAEQFPEWTPARIHEIVGVDERHVAASDECASDLAVAAATKLFAAGRASPADIDYVIHCTQGPDYFLPTTACVIQNRLGLPRHCGAVDINLGCSGYVYGLGLAKGLIESEQANRVLFLTADTYSKFPQPARQERSERARRRRGGHAADERRVRHGRTAGRSVRVPEPMGAARRTSLFPQAACDRRTTRTPPCRSTTAGTSAPPTTFT